MSDEQVGFWEAEAMAPPPTGSEKKLRDQFVDEYLIDFDQTGAAMRVGFSASFAQTYAERFMNEPYVRKRIMDLQQATAEDPKAADEADRRRVRAAMLREAHYRGAGSSHSARVSALAKLASVLDMDAPTKIKSDVTMRGGVMMVPGIASLEDWQKAAQASQEALQQDSNL